MAQLDARLNWFAEQLRRENDIGRNWVLWRSFAGAFGASVGQIGEIMQRIEQLIDRRRVLEIFTPPEAESRVLQVGVEEQAPLQFTQAEMDEVATEMTDWWIANPKVGIDPTQYIVRPAVFDLPGNDPAAIEQDYQRLLAVQQQAQLRGGDGGQQLQYFPATDVSDSCVQEIPMTSPLASSKAYSNWWSLGNGVLYIWNRYPREVACFIQKG